MYVYVIMPVASDPEYATKRAILDDVADRAELDLHLPLEQAVRRPATSDAVLADLARADLVVADLSLERPSCYFEVGLAQALRRPVVLVARAGTDVHQVFGRDAVEFYQDLDDYAVLMDKVLQPVAARS